MNNGFWLKANRWFWGISDVYDEYQKTVVDEVGNKCFILLSTANLINIIIGFLIAFKSMNLAFVYLVLAPMVVWIGVMIYGYYQIRKSGIARVEVTDDKLKQAQSSANKQTIRLTLYFLILQIVGELVLTWLDPQAQLQDVFSLNTFFQILITTALFALVVGYLLRRRIEVYEDDN